MSKHAFKRHFGFYSKAVILSYRIAPQRIAYFRDAHHIRGYFFESFPSLIQKEVERRHNSQLVTESLQEVGFQEISELKLWETRQVYANKEQLLADLQGRVGVVYYMS